MVAHRQLNGTPAEVETAFYEAMRLGDADSVMLAFAEDEEIACIHPGGPRLRGHAQIHASWVAIFERGGIDIQVQQRSVTQNLLCAVHTVVEGNRTHAGPNAHLIATNVYMKTPHGWGMVLHHVSVAPGAVPLTGVPSKLH